MGAAAAGLSVCSEIDNSPKLGLGVPIKRQKTFERPHGALGSLVDCARGAAESAKELLREHDDLDMVTERKAFRHPIAECYKTEAFYGGKRAHDADADDHANTESFMQALRVGDFRKVVDCAEGGADLTVRTMRGQDVMMLTAASRNRGTVGLLSFLMDAKIGIENRDLHGWTPLAHACRNGAREATDFLIQAKAEIDARDAAGRTPLMLACIEGSELIAGVMVAAGASVKLQDKRGWTCLFFAAEQGKQDLVKYVLRKTASPHQTSLDGSQALMVACVRGNLMAAKQIIRRGADIDHQDDNGNTALMLALVAGQLDLGFWLVEETADVEPRNIADESAYEIAEEQGFNSLKNKILSISRQREEAKKKAALEAAAQAALAARMDD